MRGRAWILSPLSARRATWTIFIRCESGAAFVMWVHSENKTKNISLHDCRATQMRIDGHDLYFKFDDGFWIIADTENNTNRETLKTDKSQLKIRNYDISDLYVFKEIRLFRRLISTHRVRLSLEKLAANINKGKWELEFIYEYHSFHSVLFSCWIWSKSKPYHRECQLIIGCDAMECFWNNLCEDKPW